EGACDYYTGSGRLQLGREKFPVPAAGFYTTDAFTDHALKFLDEAKTQNDAQPFFLYLAYNAPHDPLQVPEEELAKYRGKYLEGWEVIQQRRFARIKKTGLVPPEARLPLWPQNLPHWTELTDAQKTSEDLHMATYTAMIDRMDQNIGRVLQWLEKNNERENTLIVFVSDNGANPFGRLGTAWAHVCDTPFRLYKRNQHEGGICAPMIMRGPSSGYTAGSISPMPVHVLDFLPTFYALAGGTGRPEDIEGTDLSGLWKTGAQNRDYEMMNYLADHRYIRRNDWKLVSVDGQPWELYNISRDRTETDNLIAKNPEKAQELQAAWEKWYNSFSKKTVEAGKVTKRSHMGDQGSGIRYDPSASPKTEEE
ncbi:MAG: sulfatase-like hydrolase/transferase, partial [Kiritimatiellales bacterium]